MFRFTPILLGVLLTAGVADAQTVIRGTGGGFDGSGFLEDTVVLRVDGGALGPVRTATGTTIDADAPPATDVIHVGGCFLMPGLIDTHTHIVLHAWCKRTNGIRGKACSGQFRVVGQRPFNELVRGQDRGLRHGDLRHEPNGDRKQEQRKGRLWQHKPTADGPHQWNGRTPGMGMKNHERF